MLNVYISTQRIVIAMDLLSANVLVGQSALCSMLLGAPSPGLA